MDEVSQKTKRLFNKTFFGFLLRFVLILALSFAIVLVVGFFTASQEGDDMQTVSIGL